MSEVRTEVRNYQVDFKHDNCNGYLVFVVHDKLNIYPEVGTRLFNHVCSKCFTKVSLPKQYPYFTVEKIQT